MHVTCKIKIHQFCDEQMVCNFFLPINNQLVQKMCIHIIQYCKSVLNYIFMVYARMIASKYLFCNEPEEFLWTQQEQLLHGVTKMSVRLCFSRLSQENANTVNPNRKYVHYLCIASQFQNLFGLQCAARPFLCLPPPSLNEYLETNE